VKGEHASSPPFFPLFSSGVENNNKKNQKTGEEEEETKEKKKPITWKSLDSNGHKEKKKMKAGIELHLLCITLT